jgi:hypothetical protein
MSDGKQLLKQLNTYGFSQEDLKAALAWAEPQLPASSPPPPPLSSVKDP